MLTLIVGQGQAGVTTTSLVYGYLRDAIVVEVNPAGGDMWAWGRLPDTGLAEMAAAVLRHGEVTTQDLAGWAATTAAGVRVVAAPATGPGAAASAAAVAAVLPKLAVEAEVVVDAGRWDPDSATAGVIAAADRVLVLVVPTGVEVARLADQLPRLRQAGGDRLSVVVCDVGWGGPVRHPTGEIAGHLGCEVARLPWDPRTAPVVAGRAGRLPPGGRSRPGRWRRWRWPLLEAVRTL